MQRHPNLIIHRSIWAEMPWLCLFILSAAGTIYFTVIQPFALLSFDLFGYQLQLSPFSLVSICFLMVLMHKVYDACYYVGPDYVRSIHGRCSFKTVDMRIDYRNISGIEVDTNIYDRLVGIGDVKIGSSMSSEIEINFDGIRHPEKLRNIIEKRIAEQVH